MAVPTLDGITADQVTSSRIATRVLTCGEGTPVLFLHGNASSATFWEEIMLQLPSGYRAIAPDQRGYGDAVPDALIDATRGMKDLSDDAVALLDHMDIDKAHVVGHSLGGSVVWQMMMDYPDRILTVTQVCPGSPFGFGGTKDVHGTMCYEDGAGSGGGVVSPDFVKAIAADDRSDAPTSPRTVMNMFYFKPPFKPEREEDLLSSLLSEHTGEKGYPGDVVPSENWPGAAPGEYGPANALSPKYADNVSRLYAIDPKPPVLWVRGSHDQIISDNSMFDVGTLGAAGAIPGWPGVDVFPSQPMVSQTHAVLEAYKAAGGQSDEAIIADTGHTPYIEKPAEFNLVFHKHIASV